MTTYSGKTIPVTAIAGTDVTMKPVNTAYTLYGWLQIKATVYPVYQGARGGLFVLRTTTDGREYKYYVTDQEAKITKE